jgi:hypothetical protein
MSLALKHIMELNIPGLISGHWIRLVPDVISPQQILNRILGGRPTLRTA